MTQVPFFHLVASPISSYLFIISYIAQEHLLSVPQIFSVLITIVDPFDLDIKSMYTSRPLIYLVLPFTR